MSRRWSDLLRPLDGQALLDNALPALFDNDHFNFETTSDASSTGNRSYDNVQSEALFPSTASNASGSASTGDLIASDVGEAEGQVGSAHSQQIKSIAVNEADLSHSGSTTVAMRISSASDPSVHSSASDDGYRFSQNSELISQLSLLPASSLAGTIASPSSETSESSLANGFVPSNADYGADAFQAAGFDAAPNFNLDQIIYQLRTQWSGGAEGTYRAWFSSNVTYSIPDFYPTNATYYEAGAVIMSAVMKNTARLGFELWDDAIGISLTESVNNPAANITVNLANYTFDNNNVLTTAGGTYARPTLGSTPSGGYYPINAQQIWLNKNWTSHDTDSDLFYGGYGVSTYVHEIGHTLGLSHPGSYNGNGTYAQDAEFAQDNRQYSIMSYFGGYNATNPLTQGWTQDGTNLSWYFPSTPMVYDIAAIQATYGADYTTRAGNSTYGYNVTADVAGRSANGLSIYSFSQNSRPIFTIWDGGGNDTFDCSGSGSNQTINLLPGEYSSTVGMKNNIGIAYGCIIENAIGGSGQDAIIGNTTSNWIKGGAGNDAMDGSSGIDVAAFSGLRSAYTITPLGNHHLRVVGPDGTDIVANFEYLQFADMTISTNNAPIAAIADRTMGLNTYTTALNLLSASDADGDAVSFFQFYDANSAAGSARIWTPSGGYLAPGAYLTVGAGDLGNVYVIAGSNNTTDTMYVRAFDGTDWGNFDAFNVVTKNSKPVTTSTDHRIDPGGSARPLDWLSYSDADGQAPVYFQFYDGTSTAGSARVWTPSGGYLAAGGYLTVTTADLANVYVIAGNSGMTDQMYVRAFDGYEWGDFDLFNVRSAFNSGPVATCPDYVVVENSYAKAIEKISWSDADGETPVYFQFYDATATAGSARFWTPSGGFLATGTYLTVTTADLAQVYVGGASGPGIDQMWIRAFDGHDWGAWDGFKVNAPA